MADQSVDENDDGDDNLPTPPDGGWGWVVCAASFMAHFIADGVSASFGVLYVDLLDYFGQSKGETALVGSLFYGVPLLAGPVAGALTNKFGCRMVTIAGSLLTAVGFLGSFFCDTFGLLCFFFGIVSGLGLACVYVPAIIIVSFYFDNKRSLATGIAVSGSGTGTFVFAPFTEYLLNLYGWRGTVLITSGIVLNIAVFGALYRPLEFSRQDKRRNYERSLAKFSKLTQSTDENERVTITNGVGQRHAMSRSLQDFSTCSNNKGTGTDLRKDVLSINGLRPHASSANALDKSNHASCYSIKPVNNKENTAVESKMTLAPIERKDIFYRGSVIRLNVPKSLVKSCPQLNSQSTGETKEPLCGCIHRVTPDTLKRMLDYSLFKNVVYDLFFFSSAFLYLWSDTPGTYIVDHAKTLGVVTTDASFLISIMGITGTIGQISYGYIGDLKQVNAMLLYSISLVTCGAALALLQFAHRYELVCLVCVVFEFCLSANYTLETILIVELLGLDQLTNAYGLIMCGQGIASLSGPPIAGLLCDVTGTYAVSFTVAGVGIIVAGVVVFIMYLILRERKMAKTKCKPGTVIEVVPPDVTEKDIFL